MPGYIKKVLQKYLRKSPTKPQHSPYIVAPKNYGKEAKEPLPPNKSSHVSKEKIKRIQGIVGSILFYARSLYSTFLVGLNSIAMQQTNATINTLKRTEDLLYYAATHPEAKIRYRASKMILQIHTDAPYLSEPKARIRAARHYFLGWIPQTNQPIRLNGAIRTLCTVLKFVALSAAEAELGALFLNIKKGRVLILTLVEMGHIQPPTAVALSQWIGVGGCVCPISAKVSLNTLPCFMFKK